MQSEHQAFISDAVIQDMSEGVMTLGLDGVISFINPAGERILNRSRAELIGKRFAAAFLGDAGNDDFNQTILDAIYDPGKLHENLVPYHTGQETRQLHTITSLLHDGDTRLGLIVVIGDLTELVEMKAQFARQLMTLLDSTVRTLAVAIDERSFYTANHTRNMVAMGERFIDWLGETGNAWVFDEERRRGFLMSVWLHDVGKLAVPLEVMDKATRLGPRLAQIEERFTKISLLDQIAMLKGELSAQAYADRCAARAEVLANIRRIDTAGYLTDEDAALVEQIASMQFVDENGERQSCLLPEEKKDLLIRKGTLNDEERAVMQGHTLATARILGQIAFPPEYKDVPKWAAGHHEFLSGRGYPAHLAGEDIPREVRLLTILDIFEALTAKDRPYKKPFSTEKALAILHDMAHCGDIDGDILKLFEASRAWEDNERVQSLGR